MADPGLKEKVVPFFDFTYGTRDPVTHRVHVGVDGFEVSPDDDFDGPEDLGVPHGSALEYLPSNRWLVPQDLTVTAEISTPEQWLTLDGGPGPIHVTLPCESCESEVLPIEVATDGTGMAPGTYSGTVTFKTDVCELPECERSYLVYFDHCRQVFADSTLPIEDIVLPVGEDHEQSLTVAATNGDVADVDMIVELGGDPGLPTRPFEVWLKSPDGTEVLLKGSEHPFQTVYDDTTSPPPGELLNAFIGRPSLGTWTLRIVNTGSGAWTFDLTRWEVRLQLDDPTPCVPG